MLWTDCGDLVELIRKDFDDLWFSSLNWAAVKEETEDAKIRRFVSQLKPSDHAMLIYQAPEDKFKVLFTYVKHGLDNREAVIYVCSEAMPRQIKNAMRLFGIDVEKHEKTGALKVVHYTEVYIINGKFSIENTLSLWNRYYKEARDRKFTGLRVAGETACFFKHNLVNELIEYERALHVVLEIPIIAICSYRVDRVNKVEDPIKLYRELVKAHSKVLFTGLNEELGKIEVRRN